MKNHCILAIYPPSSIVRCMNNRSRPLTNYSTILDNPITYQSQNNISENNLNLENRKRMDKLCESFEERLNNFENYLKVAKMNITNNMLSRLKTMQRTNLYIESVLSDHSYW